MRKTVEKIIGSIPKNLTELETAYFVYLELGKILAQDTEYSLTKSLSKQSRLFEAGKNINNINFPNVICNSSSELYTYILNKLGIKAKVFYFKGLEHADTIIKTKDGNVYYANLLADLAKIQTGSRTRNFAPPSEHLNGVVYYELARKYSSSLKSLPTEELEAMDNKFGYTFHGLYMNDFIEKIKSELKNPDFVNEYILPKDITLDSCTPSELLKYKFLFLINNLNVYSESNSYKAGFSELTSFYNRLCSAVFSDEEIRKISIYTCHYSSIKNKDLSSYVSLDLSEGGKNNIVYFAFSGSENKYIPISKEELQSKVNNGLVSDGYRNIKGIERTD